MAEGDQSGRALAISLYACLYTKMPLTMPCNRILETTAPWTQSDPGNKSPAGFSFNGHTHAPCQACVRPGPQSHTYPYDSATPALQLQRTHPSTHPPNHHSHPPIHATMHATINVSYHASFHPLMQMLEHRYTHTHARTHTHTNTHTHGRLRACAGIAASHSTGTKASGSSATPSLHRLARSSGASSGGDAGASSGSGSGSGHKRQGVAAKGGGSFLRRLSRHFKAGKSGSSKRA